MAGELFDVVSKGAVKIEVNQTFALKDAAAAHIALEIAQDHREHRAGTLGRRTETRRATRAIVALRAMRDQAKAPAFSETYCEQAEDDVSKHMVLDTTSLTVESQLSRGRWQGDF